MAPTWTEEEFLTVLNPALTDDEVATLVPAHTVGGVQTVRQAVHAWHLPEYKEWGLSGVHLRVLEDRRGRAVCPFCRGPID